MATDYNKFLRDNSVESAVLLGNYDEQDNYFIEKSIRQELVSLKKVITLYKQDFMLCEAKLYDTTLKFRIDFYFDGMEGEKFANLYLLENYTNLNKNIDLETFLVSFKSSNDPMFLDKLKEAMNIFTKNELGDGKDINTSAVLEQILRTKKNVSKYIVLNMGVDNRKYCNEILKILKNSKIYPNLQSIIKKRMKGIKADKNTAKYFAMLKEILDEIIFENYNELDEETLKWLQQVNQNYILVYTDKKKEIQKPKTKVESVVAPKKKDEKKKSAGGGGKSKDNKKKSPSASSSSYLSYEVEIKPYDISIGDKYARLEFPQKDHRPPPPPRNREREQNKGSKKIKGRNYLSGKYFEQLSHGLEGAFNLFPDSKLFDFDIKKIGGQDVFDKILSEVDKGSGFDNYNNLKNSFDISRSKTNDDSELVK